MTDPAPISPRALSLGMAASLFGVAFATFLLVDGAWLVVMGPRFYRPALGALMADAPNFVAAAGFYVLFVLALVVLVVVPARGRALVGFTLPRAALFGLATYGTYDLTNFATLAGWPLSVVVVDMAWGALLSCVVASVAHLFLARGDARRA